MTGSRKRRVWRPRSCAGATEGSLA
jgi:hypothetical protein